MSESMRRIYVEKKKEYAVEAAGLLADLVGTLGMTQLTGLRIVNRYDIAGLSDEDYEAAKRVVLSEPPVDTVHDETLEIPEGVKSFAIELLPGQYDQREDFAAQCVQLISQGKRPAVAAAKVILLEGNLTDADVEKIKKYTINPVEAQEASTQKPDSLEMSWEAPKPVAIIKGFTQFSKEELHQFLTEQELAMSEADLAFIQEYFQKEGRNPSITEIKVLDTYWSDHCRHTTFETNLEKINIEESVYTEPIQQALERYLKDREFVYGKDTERPVTLMDMACLATKKMKKEGHLPDLDASEEINACSIVVPITVDGNEEEWLVMFKNETHNHPTEIEPFGGAATCLGGAIRDPLSGRSYVYQAMRVTGSGDPRTPYDKTLVGKLPQRKITQGAAAGYSSYGNQIGLATGLVEEYYHNRFVAKRMEVGAVIGAAPRDAVVRERPSDGDLVVLLGGRTGRDGMGGATGASKEHTTKSLSECGAEVQKGNPPNERKIQRLFRNPEVTCLIKRCNDFGAGGVSVAIGELAPGLVINLDKVPKKYEGLDGTELAISESQERMAVVIAAKDLKAFMDAADEENLEATVVAEVSKDPRLVMYWRGEKIVDLSRAFLDTNGISQKADVEVEAITAPSPFNEIPEQVQGLSSIKDRWLRNLDRLNVCSQEGLGERFDGTIGRGTVIMPFGGKRQLTQSEGMAARIPVLGGKTTAASVMAAGYNPNVACWSPYHGGMYAVVESVCRAAALGADPSKLRLSMQEYFPKLHDSKHWGQPLSALLGAYEACCELGLPAIGGKDSMSGTFMDLEVPPSLISFAVGVMDGRDTISNEFKKAGHTVVFLPASCDEHEVIDYDALKKLLASLHKGILSKRVITAGVVKEGGVAAAISAMCLGNELGFSFVKPFLHEECLFTLQPAGFLVELEDGADAEEVFAGTDLLVLGTLTDEGKVVVNDTEISLAEIEAAYTKTLDKIFPMKAPRKEKKDVRMPAYTNDLPLTAPYNVAKPTVFIPVFPGINCEYDTAAAFEAAGAKTDIFVIRNLTPDAIKESVEEMAKRMKQAQIMALPGGFSAGDEPDGSGKFMATMFRNPTLTEAVEDLLTNRDGLILGICNGFQALIKLGLVPYGHIVPLKDDSPTLTFNTIGRHISRMVDTKVVSNKSPWLSLCEPGDIHTIAVSHGEGRFVATEEEIKHLVANGQIGTQYVDLAGNPTMESPYNPNGSFYAVESVTSPDGRVLGKMGHSERYTDGLMKNIPGNKFQPIFLSGVQYFK
ncbi:MULTISPECIES: phosphoribosylformylglycinamidine synthase [Acidaminococcus]|uniref:phosphoribosylformylglycinamidine synthase n=1 Tax=Acidaminococcus TaxID=904 RepID=UPI0003ADAB55|nr:MULTISPECIES: phosphoribosylformylglycinamidine synthase [Acidaminococcus]ERL19645.1 phosphoribosylformylglycinamidine synthase [Acidaminococcus sp. BV3L6]